MNVQFVLSLVIVAALATTTTSSVLPWSKIVGGQFAEQHQFPHQIALFYNNAFRCGGSIIAKQWILTAAHCVLDGAEELPAQGFTVYAGSSDLSEGGEYYTVQAAFAHEAYGNSQNDIALLKLVEEIQFDESKNKIELFDGELSDGDKVVISGFGREGMTLPPSEKLKYNTMYVQDDVICDIILEMTGPGLICLNNDANNGACMGDSGGPAVFENKLVGVANFVLEKCGTVNPDGYAKVSYYLDWIAEKMQN